ncbi:YcaO-like family protein [Nocardiopsis exhalans]|uniref:YcaO-like family protein n=1 Tax=Nocardiopsis exhalans TaxID=163604 RepID=A0ABY5CZD0_9ACTN|nr:YcaO-like family protein [Nocardiopsis exhalans]USY17237.1 YcaO-like family protein [Nocardiopsis exhalans]
MIPATTAAAADERTTDHARLVDPRTGLVRSIVDFPMPPRFPRGLIARGADVANSLDPATWHADRAAVGSAFHDAEAAELAAIGEAVERYCGNFVPEGLRRASFAELRAEGTAAVDPHDLTLYSRRQYATPGFPLVPFTRNLPVRWVPGHDMVDGTPTLVPASLVYCNYHWGERKHTEPRTNGVIYAGIAAGPDRAFAEAAALEELVERDATAVWWLSGAPATGIDVSGSVALQQALVTAAEDPGVRYHFFAIPTGFDAAVVGCLLDDTENQIIGAGFACRTDPEAAALKALSEAVGTWFYSTGILDPDGSIWAAIRAGALDARAYKAHRADRRYLDDFRDDYRDVIDLGAQMQFYLDPRARVYAERMYAPPRTVPVAELGRWEPRDRRAHYLKQVAERGMRAYSVDVTTPDVAMAGLHVSRVVVPELYTNAPASLPYLGGTRLYEEPAERGWLPAPVSENELFLAPIPHV